MGLCMSSQIGKNQLLLQGFYFFSVFAASYYLMIVESHSVRFSIEFIFSILKLIIGPSVWSKTYPIAISGQKQSPINISTEACMDTESISTWTPLEYKYPSDIRNATLLNTGNGWKCDIPNEIRSDTLLKGGPLKHPYKLQQFHCHW